MTCLTCGNRGVIKRPIPLPSHPFTSAVIDNGLPRLLPCPDCDAGTPPLSRAVLDLPAYAVLRRAPVPPR